MFANIRFSKYKNTHQFQPRNVPWNKALKLATTETGSSGNTTCISAGTSVRGFHNGEQSESFGCQRYKRKEVNLMKQQIKEYEKQQVSSCVRKRVYYELVCILKISPTRPKFSANAPTVIANILSDLQQFHTVTTLIINEY